MFRILLRNCFRCSSNRPTIPHEGSFQSRHYIPKISVEDFLIRQGVTYKPTATGYKLKECPFCHKPHHNDPTNFYTLNVHKETGVFFCFRCSSKGSWLDFRGKFLGLTEHVGPMTQSFMPYPQEHNNQQFSYVEYFFFYNNMQKEEFKDVAEYLVKDRGLTKETIEKYKLGTGYEKFQNEVGETISIKVIYFPMYRMNSEKEKKLVEKYMHDYIGAKFGDEADKIDLEEFQKGRINSTLTTLTKSKIRGVGKENKKYMRQYPSGNRPGLFGLNLITANTKEIIITEGEYDAMAAHQESGIVALSLPMGANSLPDNVLPFLDNIDKIYLWMDNDEVGSLNAPKLAMKLGIKRVFMVENPNKKMKDANDVLRQDPSLIKSLLSKAKTIPGQSILSFYNLADKVRNRLMHLDKNMGVKSSYLKFFNKKVKGLRTSELTILSGGTGSGKTTLLSQLSLDFCKKGVPTMWGSFEIKNYVLISSMLHQFSNVNLSKYSYKIDHYFEKFKELPLYYMSFFGSSDLYRVFGTIYYAIEKYHISHIVIDTLQFLLSDQAIGVDKFDLQDRVLARLRKIATNHEVHVSIVIHPRKTDEGYDLGLHSIFGTSKSIQEADNVWLIQTRENFKIFEVKKNRFDGYLGKVALGFDKNTKKFFQLTANELELLFKKSASMDEIVEKRSYIENLQEHQDLQEALMKGSSMDDMLLRQRRRMAERSNPYQK